MIGASALSGLGLIIGGERGNILIGATSNAVVLYGYWQMQQARRSRHRQADEDDEEEDADG